MYFTWATADRRRAARCNPANYVCGNADGVPGTRPNTVAHVEYDSSIGVLVEVVVGVMIAEILLHAQRHDLVPMDGECSSSPYRNCLARPSAAIRVRFWQS